MLNGNALLRQEVRQVAYVPQYAVGACSRRVGAKLLQAWS